MAERVGKAMYAPNITPYRNTGFNNHNRIVIALSRTPRWKKGGSMQTLLRPERFQRKLILCRRTPRRSRSTWVCYSKDSRRILRSPRVRWRLAGPRLPDGFPPLTLSISCLRMPHDGRKSYRGPPRHQSLRLRGSSQGAGQLRSKSGRLSPKRHSRVALFRSVRRKQSRQRPPAGGLAPKPTSARRAKACSFAKPGDAIQREGGFFRFGAADSFPKQWTAGHCPGSKGSSAPA